MEQLRVSCVFIVFSLGLLLVVVDCLLSKERQRIVFRGINVVDSGHAIMNECIARLTVLWTTFLSYHCYPCYFIVLLLLINSEFKCGFEMIQFASGIWLLSGSVDLFTRYSAGTALDLRWFFPSMVSSAFNYFGVVEFR